MVVELWWSGAALLLRELTDLFCFLPKNPEGQCPAVTSCREAQAHSGYAAGQWSETHQQFHLWMAQRNNNITVLKGPSQILDFKPDWDTIAWPKQVIHAQKRFSMAELQHPAKWVKIPPHQRERLSRYCKCLTAILVVKGETASYFFTQGKLGLDRVDKLNYYLKTAFCIYSSYLCLLLTFFDDLNRVRGKFLFHSTVYEHKKSKRADFTF